MQKCPDFLFGAYSFLMNMVANGICTERFYKIPNSCFAEVVVMLSTCSKLSP